MNLVNLGLLVVGYLLGSIPSGYLAGKWLKGIDIRQYGSGSTGATNVLRTLGKGPATAVFVVDVLKGAVAIWLAQGLGTTGDPGAWMIVLVGLAAILGHSRPVWLGFGEGGKSVAVSLGMLLGMNWQVALAVAGVWAITTAISRLVSLGSILGAVAAPVLFHLWGAPLPYVLFGLLGGGYVVFRHRTNVGRLLKGTEPRIGESVSS